MLTYYLFLQLKTRPRLLCLTVVLLVCFLPFSQSANAQRLAIKSNLLADAIISPNLGVEMLLSPPLDFGSLRTLPTLPIE